MWECVHIWAAAAPLAAGTNPVKKQLFAIPTGKRNGLRRRKKVDTPVRVQPDIVDTIMRDTLLVSHTASM